MPTPRRRSTFSRSLPFAFSRLIGSATRAIRLRIGVKTSKRGLFPCLEDKDTEAQVLCVVNPAKTAVRILGYASSGLLADQANLSKELVKSEAMRKHKSAFWRLDLCRPFRTLEELRDLHHRATLAE